MTEPVQHEFHGDVSLAGYGPDCFHVECFDCGSKYYRFQSRDNIRSWIWSHTLENGFNPFLCPELKRKAGLL